MNPLDIVITSTYDHHRAEHSRFRWMPAEGRNGATIYLLRVRGILPKGWLL